MLSCPRPSLLIGYAPAQPRHDTGAAGYTAYAISRWWQRGARQGEARHRIGLRFEGHVLPPTVETGYFMPLRVSRYGDATVMPTTLATTTIDAHARCCYVI